MPLRQSRSGLVLRATLLGLAVAGVLVAAVLGSGLFELGTGMVLLGYGLAALAAAVVALLQRAALGLAAGSPTLAGQQLEIQLLSSFVVKLLVLGLGTGALWLLGLKFVETATFALTFVAAALVSQVVAAGCLYRALARGGASRGTKNSS